MTSEVWRRFAQDPRDPQNAWLRAGDEDRAVAAELLAGAYAEGRLDPEEHEERAGLAARARTLGELPPLVADLVPTTSSPAVRQERAEAYWRERRRASIGVFLAITVVSWTVYLLSNDLQLGPGVPWSVWVTAFAGLLLGRTLASREHVVGHEVRRLERLEAASRRRRRR